MFSKSRVGLRAGCSLKNGTAWIILNSVATIIAPEDLFRLFGSSFVAFIATHILFSLSDTTDF